MASIAQPDRRMQKVSRNSSCHHQIATHRSFLGSLGGRRLMAQVVVMGEEMGGLFSLFSCH